MLAVWGLKFIYTIWKMMAGFWASASCSVCLFRLFERTYLNLHWNWFILKMDATCCPETSKPAFHGVKIQNTTTNGTTSTLKTSELLHISSSYLKEYSLRLQWRRRVRVLHGNNRWWLQVSQKHKHIVWRKHTAYECYSTWYCPGIEGYWPPIYLHASALRTTHPQHSPARPVGCVTSPACSKKSH